MGAGASKIKQGQRFEITHPITPGTGYSVWIDTTPGLAVVDERFVRPTLNSHLVGQSQQVVWTLVATEPGRQVIYIHEGRRWEPPSTFKTETIHVSVQ